MTAVKQYLLRYGPAVVMTSLVLALSLLPLRFFREAAQPLPPLPGLDKIAHALMYAALTAAYLHLLRRASRGRLAAVLCVAAIATLYGLAMETFQKLFTLSRTMDPLDALANAAGAFASALLIYGWTRGRTAGGGGEGEAGKGGDSGKQTEGGQTPQ